MQQSKMSKIRATEMENWLKPITAKKKKITLNVVQFQRSVHIQYTCTDKVRSLFGNFRPNNFLRREMYV